jgi:hypothetical protein
MEDPTWACDVALLLYPNPSEFPLGLGVSTRMKDGCDFETWLRGLARALSVHCRTRTICDGTPYGDTVGPYWSLIWNNGEPILGYDLETTISDGAGGPVKVVRALDLARVTFTPAEELATWIRRGPNHPI